MQVLFLWQHLRRFTAIIFSGDSSNVRGAPRKVGLGCGPLPKILICDLTKKFNPLLFMTVVVGTVALNIVYAGLWLMPLIDKDEKVASKNKPSSRLQWEN